MYALHELRKHNVNQEETSDGCPPLYVASYNGDVCSSNSESILIKAGGNVNLNIKYLPFFEFSHTRNNCHTYRSSIFIIESHTVHVESVVK